MMVFLFWISILLIGLHVFYPCLIVLMSFFIKRIAPSPVSQSDRHPLISVIIPVHGNAVAFLRKKMENLLDSTYPCELLEIIVGGDGSPSDLQELMREFTHLDNVKSFQTGTRVGKNEVLNRAVCISRGEVLIFSDADALFRQDAIATLVDGLNHPEAGGLCGKHIIQRKTAKESCGQSGALQALYWRYESWIKRLELQTLGSVTSNYGTIFAMRKSLFRTLPPNVTDDLFLALCVIGSGHRFLYEPKALAYISPPSKDLHSELKRRRRIVGRSLNSIWLNRQIFLSPSILALFLFIHKVLRRLTPLLLMIVFFSSLLLPWKNAIWGYLFASQLFFYASSAMFFFALPSTKPFTALGYFAAVNVGTFLGILDFLRGKSTAVWE